MDKAVVRLLFDMVDLSPLSTTIRANTIMINLPT